MSGTSVDGIDAVLVKMGEQEGGLPVQLLAGATYPYPPQLRKKILAACEGAPLSLAELAALDDAIAAQFALAAQKIQEGHPPAQLIGSHGQTVLHRSPLMGDGKQPAVVELGYSLQLGRGETIAHLTGVATVSNFRAADVAAGGQGAPLVPKVDAYLLSHPSRHRCIQNLGGIGNLTYLPPSQQEGWQEAVWGWDTGPGNVLLDLAVQRLTQGRETYDRDGSWAARGTPCQALVEQWLQGDFFRTPPPKSTGRELFGEAYLTRCWQQSRGYQLSEADWLASLTELTAASIARSYQDFLPKMPDEVLLCGGGSHNAYLRQRLQVQLPPETVLLTVDEVGIDSDFKEAIAFAVLAYWRFYASIPGNLPLVTGAKRAVLLGEIHFPFA